MTAAEDQLAEWLDSLLERFLYLRDDELVEDIDLDFSATSLRRLEVAVLEGFDSPEDVRDPDQEDFALGVAAYLGEVLMRLAGGSWSWDNDFSSASFDLPLVRPDPVLGLDQVSPIGLIMAAVRSGDRERFGAVYSAWESTVQRVATQRPSWHPTKEPTDMDLVDPADSQRLLAWLAGGESGFANWAAAYAPGATLDFSPESLSALEEAVRSVAPTREDLMSPVNREFVDEASWYLGEVLRRRLGGQWTYGPSDPDSGGHYLRQVGPHEATIVPAIWLRNAMNRPGHLREHYDAFAGRPGH